MQKIDLSLLNSIVTHFVDIKTSDDYIFEIGVYSCELNFSVVIFPSELGNNSEKTTNDEATAAKILNEKFRSLVLWTDSNIKIEKIESIFEKARVIMEFKIKNIYNAIPPQYGYSLLKEIEKETNDNALLMAKNIYYSWGKFKAENSI